MSEAVAAGEQLGLDQSGRCRVRYRRLARSRHILHRVAQLSHAGRDTNLQTGTDRLRVHIGLLARQCTALRDSGAPTDIFEGPDKSA